MDHEACFSERTNWSRIYYHLTGFLIFYQWQSFKLLGVFFSPEFLKVNLCDLSLTVSPTLPFPFFYLVEYILKYCHDY